MGWPKGARGGGDLSLMLKGSNKDFLQQVRASGMGEGEKLGRKRFSLENGVTSKELVGVFYAMGY